jgi:TorA maturation chaperone TorD
MIPDECFLEPPDSELAALWVTLARAFLPPLEPDHWRALHADLPLDLADWSRELGLVDAPNANSLLDALVAYPEHEALLVHYSGLFYAPPIRVHLNLGLYLDGTSNGPSLDALTRWHAAYGLDRSSQFHDLSDHISAVLEFLGVITELEERRLAAEFAHRFLLPALPRLIARLELEGALASPYLWLLRFTQTALAQSYPAPEVAAVPAKPRYRVRPVSDGWRQCRLCGEPIASEKELMVMEKALAEAGLPVEHLSLCPDCRSAQQGWEKRALP